jgi:iron complex outermembrane receptor protein
MALAIPAIADEAYELPGLNVTEQKDDDIRFTTDPSRSLLSRPGTAELLKRTPGANVNFNGPLTGITQYRGMFGNRMNVLVDGLHINSGGPNSMDPPLHYMPRPRVEGLEIFRGIAPVSSGLETIGGTIMAHSKRGEFSEGENFELSGYVDGGGQSVDKGYSAGGIATLSNNRHLIELGGSREKGDDTDFGDGTIADTAYDRNTYDLGYGFRSDSQEMGIRYLHNDTNETGTPALPMDIIFFDSDFINGDYHADIGDMSLDAKLGYSKIDHQMNNFELRAPPPDQARYRFTNADSRGWTYTLKALKPLAMGNVNFGIDGNLAQHNATIFNPNNSNFFVQNFNDVNRDRWGVFTEWRSRYAGAWGSELGLRYTRVDMEAGQVDGTPAQTPGGPQVLRDRFNNAKRDITDNNIDAVVKINYQLRPDLKAELGLARKTRSPSYQESYLWLPLQATGGLADGNNYVGNLELDPELAYQVELSLNWQTRDLYLIPHIFYRRVNDYIQGTPVSDPVVLAVSTANGDPSPLQFNNVEAEFYGVDLEAGYALTESWHADALLSLVRGERRDIDDNLYRIAPPNATVAMSYIQPRWSASVEGEFYAKQDKVSQTNEETPSAGYGLLNLFGQYTLYEAHRTTTTLRAGIDNVLDKTYQPHLNGTNRVRNSDVPVGERQPGPGRNFYARLNVEF